MTTFEDKVKNHQRLDDLVQNIAFEVAMKAKSISRNVSKLYDNAVKEKNKIRRAIFDVVVTEYE